MKDKDEALHTAHDLFGESAAEHFFSAPNANRFVLQFLDGEPKKAVLACGSAGVVFDSKLQIYKPVAKVLFAVTIEPGLLRDLVRVIEELTPQVGGNEHG